MRTSCGGSVSISGQGQVDAAAVVEEAKVDGGGIAQVLGRREEEHRDEEARGENEMDPSPIYKARKINGMRGNRGG